MREKLQTLPLVQLRELAKAQGIKDNRMTNISVNNRIRRSGI